MPSHLYSGYLVEQMHDALDARELRLYQVGLSSKQYQKITASLPMCNPDKASQREHIQRCLQKCREAFDQVKDKQEKLSVPIGSCLMGRKKLVKGLGAKRWPIWGAYIQNAHQLYRPFYPISGRGWNKKRAKHKKGYYPVKLIRSIQKFLQTEFPTIFCELSFHDVASRVQFGEKRRVKRQLFCPRKGAKMSRNDGVSF